ncbi:MAG: hypothetical protein IT161_23430 [Bryobacterales bacterium]|nr:hypothetical protein [Bryobacterales bacterium]
MSTKTPLRSDQGEEFTEVGFGIIDAQFEYVEVNQRTSSSPRACPLSTAP